MNCMLPAFFPAQISIKEHAGLFVEINCSETKTFIIGPELEIVAFFDPPIVILSLIGQSGKVRLLEYQLEIGGRVIFTAICPDFRDSNDSFLQPHHQFAGRLVSSMCNWTAIESVCPITYIEGI